MSTSRSKQLVFLALSISLLSICAWLTIPMAIPFTMQTFAIFLTLALFGGKFGTTAIGLYLVMGFAGLPVFSGFRSGFSVLLGPTGGYLLGFLFMALFYWLFTKLFGDSLTMKSIALLIGLLIVYTFGTAYFMLVYLQNTGSMGVMAVLNLCVFPYVLPDIGKLLLAMLIAKRLSGTISLSK